MIELTNQPLDQNIGQIDDEGDEGEEGEDSLSAKALDLLLDLKEVVTDGNLFLDRNDDGLDFGDIWAGLTQPRQNSKNSQTGTSLSDAVNVVAKTAGLESSLVGKGLELLVGKNGEPGNLLPGSLKDADLPLTADLIGYVAKDVLTEDDDGKGILSYFKAQKDGLLDLVAGTCTLDFGRAFRGWKHMAFNYMDPYYMLEKTGLDAHLPEIIRTGLTIATGNPVLGGIVGAVGEIALPIQIGIRNKLKFRDNEK